MKITRLLIVSLGLSLIAPALAQDKPAQELTAAEWRARIQADKKGIVERGIVRVVTPGTVTEEECLDPAAPNYLVAIASGHAEIGLAAIDLSTGEVRVAAIADNEVCV